MKNSLKLIQTVRYLGVTVISILILQSIVVVVHEFTHSTTAYFLGEMKNPLGIIWGNPVMMTGWDEGVDYNRIFAQGHDLHGAFIGVLPLIMHSIVACICLFFMTTGRLRNKWEYHSAFWLAVVNLMELVAYIYMRAFANHGDVGLFNKGMDLSPWWVFLIGGAFVSYLLWLLLSKALPELLKLFAVDNIICGWAVLILSSSILFLWGSGLRVLFYIDGPQRLFGVVGVLLFAFSLFVFKPRSSIH